MRKVIFGIFAHPDDEAFGPAGTLLMEAKDGAEIHLITLTLGDAGENPDKIADLLSVREKEWREAGVLIGATHMHSLNYKDGTLNNLAMIEIQAKLLTLIKNVVATLPAESEYELMSMDLNGITGHIDHIVAGRTASYLFETLKQTDARLSKLRLMCVPRSDLYQSNTRWIYQEAGRTDEEIDEVVDARHLKEEIKAIIRTHHSQRKDGQAHLEARGDDLGKDYFIVRR